MALKAHATCIRHVVIHHIMVMEVYRYGCFMMIRGAAVFCRLYKQFHTGKACGRDYEQKTQTRKNTYPAFTAE